MTDQYVWPRECVVDSPNGAWCSVCRHRFASAEAFGIHRGIKVRPRNEDSQDAGVCMPVSIRRAAGLQALDNIWYTLKDAAMRNRMLGARAARQKGNPS
jgi:hypothetical protein